MNEKPADRISWLFLLVGRGIFMVFSIVNEYLRDIYFYLSLFRYC